MKAIPDSKMHLFYIYFWSDWLVLVEVEKAVLILYIFKVTISIIEKMMLNQIRIDAAFSTLNLPMLI